MILLIHVFILCIGKSNYFLTKVMSLSATPPGVSGPENTNRLTSFTVALSVFYKKKERVEMKLKLNKELEMKLRFKGCALGLLHVIFIIV